MSETALVLRDYSRLAVEIGPEAHHAINNALQGSSLLGKVDSAESQELAVEVRRQIRTVIKKMEDCRKLVKNPVLDYAKRIDTAVKEAVRPLEEEDNRLGDLVQEFQREELRKAQEAERRRLEELARIEREKQEEQARIQRELEAKAARERSETEKRRLVEEATKRQREAEERAKQAMEATGPANLPTKAKGQTVREVLRFEVVDIWLLVRMSPGLVRVEPNRQEINEVINRLAPTSPGGVPNIPGLRIWKDVATGVRVGQTKERGVIDV